MDDNTLLAFALAAVASIGGSLVLTPVAAVLGRRAGLVDRPREGELQKQPVPRSGGYGLIVAFLLATGLSLLLVPRDQGEITRIIGLIVGALLVIPISLVDDYKRLGPLPQLVGQIALAIVAIASGLVIDSVANPFGGMVSLPVIIALPFTLFWVVGMINTLNWIDTMDGLAAGVAAIAGLILFIRSVSLGQYTISLLPLAFCGVCLGFLWFNFNPARVIMGTSGSTFLGFALATLALIGGAKIATAAFVLCLPIVDTGMVILQRSAGRRSPLRGGDHAHLTHRLVRRGLSTRSITLLIYLVCAIGGTLGMVLSGVEKLWILVVVGALAVIVALRLASARVAD